MVFDERYGVTIKMDINDKTQSISGSSIFGGTINQIKQEHSKRVFKAAVSAGDKAAIRFSQLANETYWWHDHPYHTGKLINSWEVVNSGSLQWQVENTATNPENATIPDLSVNYIADLETIWNKPFVRQANDLLNEELYDIVEKELSVW